MRSTVASGQLQRIADTAALGTLNRVLAAAAAAAAAALAPALPL
jgi:hypothetical protein